MGRSVARGSGLSDSCANKDTAIGASRPLPLCELAMKISILYDADVKEALIKALGYI
jgi:hypothetical protein